MVDLGEAMIRTVTLDRRDATRPGHIGPNAGEAELGDMFLPQEWGRGYAAEGCAAAQDRFAGAPSNGSASGPSPRRPTEQQNRAQLRCRADGRSQASLSRRLVGCHGDVLLGQAPQTGEYRVDECRADDNLA